MFNLDEIKGQRLLGVTVTEGGWPLLCERLSLRFEDTFLTFSARVGSSGRPYIVKEVVTPLGGECPCCKQYFTTTSASYSEEKPYDGRCPSCRNYEAKVL